MSRDLEDERLIDRSETISRHGDGDGFNGAMGNEMENEMENEMDDEMVDEYNQLKHSESNVSHSMSPKISTNLNRVNDSMMPFSADMNRVNDSMSPLSANIHTSLKPTSIMTSLAPSIPLFSSEPTKGPSSKKSDDQMLNTMHQAKQEQKEKSREPQEESKETQELQKENSREVQEPRESQQEESREENMREEPRGTQQEESREENMREEPRGIQQEESREIQEEVQEPRGTQQEEIREENSREVQEPRGTQQEESREPQDENPPRKTFPPEASWKNEREQDHHDAHPHSDLSLTDIQTSTQKFNPHHEELTHPDYPHTNNQLSSAAVTQPNLSSISSPRDRTMSDLDQESSAFISNPEINTTNIHNNYNDSYLDQESSAFITNPEINDHNQNNISSSAQEPRYPQLNNHFSLENSNISNTNDFDGVSQHSLEDGLSNIQKSFASLKLEESKKNPDDSFDDPNKTPEQPSVIRGRKQSSPSSHYLHQSEDVHYQAQTESPYDSPHSSAKSSVLDRSPARPTANHLPFKLQESYAPTPPTSQPENYVERKKPIIFNKSFDEDHDMPTKLKGQNSAGSPLSHATSPGNNNYTDFSNLETPCDLESRRKTTSPLRGGSISAKVSPRKTGYRSSPLRKSSMGQIDDEAYNNETIDSLDSTRYNETQAQLDRDIDIDDSAKEAAKIEKLKAKTNLSPWKRLRAPSNFGISEQQQQRSDSNKYQGIKGGFSHAKSFSLASSFQNSNEMTSNASSAARINELNKQITGYKIQIRFFKQFLSNLIDKARREPQSNGTKTDIFDIHELTDFQDNFDVLSPVESQANPMNQQRMDQDYTKLQEEYKKLSSHYDEIYQLNEDLYSNLEEFQAQLQDKEFQLQSLYKNFENCVGIVQEIVQLLINDPTTDEMSRIALLRCLDDQFVINGASDTLDMKLHVIRIEISKKLEPFEHTVTSVPTTHQMTSSSSNADKNFGEINNHTQVVHDLMQMLNTMQVEFESRKIKVLDLENDIQREIEQSDILRQNQQVMQSKFDHVCKLLEDERASKLSPYDEEMARLRHENDRLLAINRTVDAKFEEYQILIDNLQREVNEFKEYTSRRESLGDESRNQTSNSYILKGSFAANNNQADNLHEETYLLHKEFNSLQNEFNDLTQQYRKLQDDSSRTISSLTTQLAEKKSEILNLKADEMVNDKLKQELDLSIEKQRILKAEKIRLSYKVDSLSEDKGNLQNTIRSLTDKVTALTVADDDHEKSSVTASDNFAKQVNFLEYQLDAFIQFDVYQFQKLLKSFNKIADDSSLKEPKKKIENLAKSINNNTTDHAKSPKVDMNLIKEYHKSISDYFARAVDIIVNDHVKLLLKENDETNKTNGYINKLHGRIDQLNMINESLSKQIDTYEANENSSSDVSTINMTTNSPRSRMRIEELSNRWKAEREARVYESKEAQRRLRELEEENTRLREMMNNQHV